MAVVVRTGLEITVPNISVITPSLISATVLEHVCQMVMTMYASVLRVTLESSATSQQQLAVCRCIIIVWWHFIVLIV